MLGGRRREKSSRMVSNVCSDSSGSTIPLCSSRADEGQSLNSEASSLTAHQLHSCGVNTEYLSQFQPLIVGLTKLLESLYTRNIADIPRTITVEWKSWSQTYRLIVAVTRRGCRMVNRTAAPAITLLSMKLR